jgi:hypothetical protein
VKTYILKHAFGSEQTTGDLVRARAKARRLRDSMNLHSITVLDGKTGERLAVLSTKDENDE